MKTRIVLIFVGLTIIGSTFATSYNYLEDKHKTVSKEIKLINHHIEKTEGIVCYTPFQKFFSAFLNLFPFSNPLRKFFFSNQMKCEDSKRVQLLRLQEKKKIREDHRDRYHRKIKQVHPTKTQNSIGASVEGVEESQSLDVGSAKGETTGNKYEVITESSAENFSATERINTLYDNNNEQSLEAKREGFESEKE